MKKSKVVIYGTGTLAQYLAYVISQDKKVSLSGFCIEKEYMRDSVPYFPHLPLVEFDGIEKIFPPGEFLFFVAIGNNLIRGKIYKKLKEKGYSFINCVSPKSIVSDDLELKENVFISEGCGIQPFVRIGNNTIVIGSKIGHHSSIGDNVLLSCCYVGGSVKIGNNTFVGLNATIKQNTIIASDNVIGMGCAITNNTQDGEVYSCKKSTVRRMVPSERLNKVI